MPHADHVPGEVRRQVGKDGGDQAGAVGKLGADSPDQLVEMLLMVVAYGSFGDPGKPPVRLGPRLVVGARVVPHVHGHLADRRVGDGVVAVVAEEVVCGVLPVGVHHPLVHTADHLRAAGPPVEHDPQLPLLATEIVQQRRRLGVEGPEDQPLVHVQLGHFHQAPLRHVQFAAVDLLHAGDAREPAVVVVAPAVVGAHERLGVAPVRPAHAVAPVAAHVEERADGPVAAPAEQHRVFSHVGGEEVVGVGDLGLVSEEEPAACEYALQFLLVYVPGDEDAAVEQPPFRVHETVHAVHLVASPGLRPPQAATGARPPRPLRGGPLTAGR